MAPTRSTIQPLDALARATILARTRKPDAVARAIEESPPSPPDTDLAVADDALRVRGLHPWIPPDPAAGAVLIVRGHMPDCPGVAVVGARASDPYGLAVAEASARAIVTMGRSVVSGGAEGCDAAAHLAALASGGHTIVVLGSGHDRPYPSHHRELFDKVVANGGAIVSPFWPETPPAKYRFLTRNRTIAGLASAVVVARARRRSGALSTARAARSLGRPLLAVPGPVGEALSEGPHHLLGEGAAPMCGEASLRQALGESGGTTWPVTHVGTPSPWTRVASERSTAPLSAEGRRVLAVLATCGATELEALVTSCALSVSDVLSALMELELAERVTRLGCGRVKARELAPGTIPPQRPRQKDGK